MLADLFAGMDDESLAEQADLWRYASRNAREGRDWRRATWCRRWQDLFEEELYRRTLARELVARAEQQLTLDGMPTRIAPVMRLH